jgi:hypothetical protein
VDYDNDSALGGMTPTTSTMSVTSSIYNFVEENGRTYHRFSTTLFFTFGNISRGVPLETSSPFKTFSLKGLLSGHGSRATTPKPPRRVNC